MSAVLLSIRPNWCQLIMSGKKTVEVRKTNPNLKVPFKCYIYETKAEFVGSDGYRQLGRGKIIGEFVCDAIDKFKVFENGSVQYWNAANLEKSCLSYDEIAEYIGKEKYGYALRISDLVIYSKSKNLSEFHKPCSDVDYCLNRTFRDTGNSLDKCFDCDCKIVRPPQSWCYVEELSENV